LEANHIGAVVVQDAGRVRGIVTDRDVALRVIGFELPAKETKLRDIMTPEPTTVSIQDSEEQVIAAMRAKHIRRVPIVEGERVKGIVSLDELLVTGAIDPTAPSRHKRAGATHPVASLRSRAAGRPMTGKAWRHWARSEQTLRDFSGRLQRILGWSDADQAIVAFELVASSIARRVTPQEAQDFAAQLPSVIREWLLDLTTEPDFTITRASIEKAMAVQLNLEQAAAAEVVRRIGQSLGEFVTEGELRHVVSQLPTEMKELLLPPEDQSPGFSARPG
jgi:uncharacterized protein (DUF2267 family)